MVRTAAKKGDHWQELKRGARQDQIDEFLAGAAVLLKDHVDSDVQQDQPVQPVPSNGRESQDMGGSAPSARDFPVVATQLQC